MTTAQGEEVLRKLHDDFGYFLRALWFDRGYDQPGKAPLSDMELDIANWLAYGGGTHESQLRGALAPRGEGKTHKIAALACWRLYRDAERKILIVSKAERHAKNIISLIGKWFDGVWFLRHLRPKRGDPDSAHRLQVGPARPSIQASITAIGFDGTLEGNRAHSIYADDIETDVNTQTPETRLWLMERCGEFKDILFPAGPEQIDQPECVVIGTFHHDTDSVYQKLADQDYMFRTWPLCCPQRSDKFINLAPMIVAGLASGKFRYTVDERYEDYPLFGHRFDRQNVLSKKKSRLRFDKQHMLKVNMADTARYPLRLADLIVMEVHRDKAPLTVVYGRKDAKGESTVVQDIPHMGFGDDFLHGPVLIDKVWCPYSRHIGYVDPAGRGDRTGLSCIGVLNGMIFVKGCYGLDGGSSGYHVSLIARQMRLHGCREGWCETNNDPSNTFFPLLQAELRKLFVDPGDPEFPDGWSCTLEPDHVTRQKELRIIETIEPVASQKRLIVDLTVVKPDPGDTLQNAFQHQFSRINKDRGALEEDGKIDSLASAIRKASEAMEVNPEEHRTQQIDDDYKRDARYLAKLRKRAMGQAPRAARWYTPRWERA